MNINLLEARLTRLCEGRPLCIKICVITQKPILTIAADYQLNTVSSYLENEDVSSDESLANLAKQLITTLDAKTYPERQKRINKAIKAEMEEKLKPV